VFYIYWLNDWSDVLLFFLEFLGYFIFFNALWWEGHLVLLINRYEDITVCCTLGFGRVLLWPKNRIDALE